MFNELQAFKIFFQILEVLSLLNKKQIVHRDLKMENILFCNEDLNDLSLKVIDFGLAIMLKNSKSKIMSERYGTLGYMAPEILRKEAYT